MSSGELFLANVAWGRQSQKPSLTHSSDFDIIYLSYGSVRFSYGTGLILFSFTYLYSFLDFYVRFEYNITSSLVTDLNRGKKNMSKEKTLSTSHYDGLEIAGERIDPMWVYKKFKLHKKDESGALYHILKTVLRFGKKNEEVREYQAIIASATRGLELKQSI